MEPLKYWQKQSKKAPLFPDLAWNIPEQKTGVITVIGGHSGAFASALRISEDLLRQYPLQEVRLVLPDSVKKHLPPLSNLIFTPASSSGSFAPSSELDSALASAEYSLLIGDFSKNSETTIAITKALAPVTTPVLLTRDTIDLITADAEKIIMLPQLTLVATMAQLQKLFRALYYPKMILFSMPLTQIVETLHKFTLSYSCTILTFHAGQIIVAHQGRIATTPISDTTFTPLSLWSGQLASRIAALQLYNPETPFEAAISAIM